MTIDRWIVDAASANPVKNALIFGNETISYAEFSSRITQCSTLLKSMGVKHGCRVAWYGQNHPDVFTLLFACARLGAILVPLNWRLSEPEVAAIVENCTPTVLFHDEKFAKPASALSAVTTYSHHIIHQESAYRMSSAADSASVSVSVSASASASETALNEAIKPSMSDPVLLVYTSGSTGSPKGVVLTQKSISCNAAMSVDAHGLTDSDRALVVLPLFHVGGLNILPTPAFSVGATVELHAGFIPDQACDALVRASLMIVVPTVLQAMMHSTQWSEEILSNLRCLSIGSTDVPVPLIESVHKLGVPLIQIYGATETGPFAIYQKPAEALDTVGSIGRAGSECEIRLVADGMDVNVDEAGEIWVKGENTLLEYWEDELLTKQMIHDGWFKTGDVAKRDAQGLYWFTDRIKHVIISGGENIYPTEIERVLQQMPGIDEVAVVGRSHAKWGEVPVAVVVTSIDITADDVLAELDGTLARYKHPKEVVFVESLPRNAMGKVVADQVRLLLERA